MSSLVRVILLVAIALMHFGLVPKFSEASSSRVDRPYREVHSRQVDIDRLRRQVLGRDRAREFEMAKLMGYEDQQAIDFSKMRADMGDAIEQRAKDFCIEMADRHSARGRVIYRLREYLEEVELESHWVVRMVCEVQYFVNQEHYLNSTHAQAAIEAQHVIRTADPYDLESDPYLRSLLDPRDQISQHLWIDPSQFEYRAETLEGEFEHGTIADEAWSDTPVEEDGAAKWVQARGFAKVSQRNLRHRMEVPQLNDGMRRIRFEEPITQGVRIQNQRFSPGEMYLPIGRERLDAFCNYHRAIFERGEVEDNPFGGIIPGAPKRRFVPPVVWSEVRYVDVRREWPWSDPTYHNICEVTYFVSEDDYVKSNFYVINREIEKLARKINTKHYLLTGQSAFGKQAPKLYLEVVRHHQAPYFYVAGRVDYDRQGKGHQHGDVGPAYVDGMRVIPQLIGTFKTRPVEPVMGPIFDPTLLTDPLGPFLPEIPNASQEEFVGPVLLEPPLPRIRNEVPAGTLPFEIPDPLVAEQKFVEGIRLQLAWEYHGDDEKRESGTFELDIYEEAVDPREKVLDPETGEMVVAESEQAVTPEEDPDLPPELAESQAQREFRNSVFERFEWTPPNRLEHEELRSSADIWSTSRWELGRRKPKNYSQVQLVESQDPYFREHGLDFFLPDPQGNEFYIGRRRFRLNDLWGFSVAPDRWSALVYKKFDEEIEIMYGRGGAPKDLRVELARNVADFHLASQPENPYSLFYTLDAVFYHFFSTEDYTYAQYERTRKEVESRRASLVDFANSGNMDPYQREVHEANMRYLTKRQQELDENPFEPQEEELLEAYLDILAGIPRVAGLEDGTLKLPDRTDPFHYRASRRIATYALVAWGAYEGIFTDALKLKAMKYFEEEFKVLFIENGEMTPQGMDLLKRLVGLTEPELHFDYRFKPSDAVVAEALRIVSALNIPNDVERARTQLFEFKNQRASFQDNSTNQFLRRAEENIVRLYRSMEPDEVASNVDLTITDYQRRLESSGHLTDEIRDYLDSQRQPMKVRLFIRRFEERGENLLTTQKPEGASPDDPQLSTEEVIELYEEYIETARSELTDHAQASPEDIATLDAISTQTLRLLRGEPEPPAENAEQAGDASGEPVDNSNADADSGAEPEAGDTGSGPDEPSSGADGSGANGSAGNAGDTGSDNGSSNNPQSGESDPSGNGQSSSTGGNSDADGHVMNTGSGSVYWRQRILRDSGAYGEWLRDNTRAFDTLTLPEQDDVGSDPLFFWKLKTAPGDPS